MEPGSWGGPSADSIALLYTGPQYARWEVVHPRRAPSPRWPLGRGVRLRVPSEERAAGVEHGVQRCDDVEIWDPLAQQREGAA
jgi:hypothetical protein